MHIKPIELVDEGTLFRYKNHLLVRLPVQQFRPIYENVVMCGKIGEVIDSGVEFYHSSTDTINLQNGTEVVLIIFPTVKQ